MQEECTEWNHCRASEHSMNCINTLRQLSDLIRIKSNSNKSVIKLDLGDLTVSEVFPKCHVAFDALKETVKGMQHNGYAPAVGSLEARIAVAEHYSHPSAPITPNQVILTSGCSHALQIAIESLVDPGDNILSPSPGFSLYSTLMTPHKIENRFYPLIMEDSVRIDLSALERLIDHRTKAILVNNPSNPTGSIFSRTHLEDLLMIAYRRRLPIISDEVYGELSYDNTEFFPIATLKPEVPVICCDGISKRYMVPGWRLGWIIVHNRYRALDKVHEGMINLAQKIVGPCSLVQGALPTILKDTPKHFFDYTNSILQANANIVCACINKIPGLKLIKPTSTIFAMIKIDMDYFNVDEDEFVEGLISEENVYCLPGKVFHAPPGFIRIVLNHSQATLRDACQRIMNYCSNLKRRY